MRTPDTVVEQSFMTLEQLQAENAELRLRLEEAEDTIRAVQAGAVDAFVVEEPDGVRVYTLEGADRPYRLLVERMQQGAATLHADGRIVYCNQRLAELLKVPHERLIGAVLRDFIAGDDRSVYDSLLSQAETRSGQGETHLRQADGGLVPAYLTLNVLPKGCGALIGVLVTDLTTQKHHERLTAAHQALLDSEHRIAEDLASMTRLQQLSTRLVQTSEFSLLLEEILDAAIALTHADMGDIQLFDQGELHIVAQRGFEAPFLEFFSAVHEGKASCGMAMKHRERVIVEDVAASPIFAGTLAGDVMLTARACAVQSTPLINRAGRLVGMFSTHYRTPRRPDDRELRLLDLLARQAADLIERVHAEAALLSKERQLRHITDNAAVMLAQVSRDLRFVFANRACAELHGRTVEQIIGRPIREVLGEPAFAAIEPYINRVLAGERVEYETRIPYASAGARYMRVVYVPDVDARGEVCGWIAAITDIQDVKAAEEALQEADRRKDEFLATLAHELRNPLAPLRSALHFLELGGGGESLRQTCALMERQVESLARLVDDLLDVSRITRGKINLEKLQVDLASVVARAVEGSRPVIEERGHTFAVALPEEPVLVTADPMRLAQVFLNLLNNAAKYTPEGGRIWLTAATEGNEAVVRVRDTGVGIAAEMLSKVFDLFTQVDGAIDRTQSGLGIGLTLVRRLTELQGGTVTGFSDGPGRGSEFVVRLPLAPAEPPSGATAEQGGTDTLAGPVGVARWRLLVVDDNKDSADSLAMLLRLLGNEVSTAHDGPQALRAIADDRPDVVFLDIGMPGMSGYAVAQAIRARPELEGLVLIALTGFGSDEDRRQARAAGFDAHLVKPVQLTVLRALLAEGAFPARS